jgi:hypothetical protein
MTEIAVAALADLETRIAPFRRQLVEHALYSRLNGANELRRFMEVHVFAVWDFMSLLKALQAQLSCVTVPWHPTRWPESRRFINEIVLGEESDVYEGRALSHFELYVEAMEQCGADTQGILNLLPAVSTMTSPRDLQQMLEGTSAPPHAIQFIRNTFQLIDSGDLSSLAAAFTFGREDLIPYLFRELVRDQNNDTAGRFSKFLWYLERHVEVDSDDHGPLARRLLADLCGNDPASWERAASAAEAALHARLQLWDGILASLEGPQG